MPLTQVYNNGQLIAIEDGRTLSEAKESSLFILEDKYLQKLKSGYYDSTLNITIGISPTDAQAFVNDLAGLDAALASGAQLTSVPISDLTGGFHVLTVAQYRGLIGRAWAYTRNLWAEKATAEAAVKASNTIALVDATLGGVSWIT